MIGVEQSLTATSITRSMVNTASAVMTNYTKYRKENNYEIHNGLSFFGNGRGQAG